MRWVLVRVRDRALRDLRRGLPLDRVAHGPLGVGHARDVVRVEVALHVRHRGHAVRVTAELHDEPHVPLRVRPLVHVPGLAVGVVPACRVDARCAPGVPELVHLEPRGRHGRGVNATARVGVPRLVGGRSRQDDGRARPVARLRAVGTLRRERARRRHHHDEVAVGVVPETEQALGAGRRGGGLGHRRSVFVDRRTGTDQDEQEPQNKGLNLHARVPPSNPAPHPIVRLLAGLYLLAKRCGSAKRRINKRST